MLGEWLIGVLCLFILIIYYLIAKMDNIIGLIFRAIWNFWFKIFSCIPFFGWMSHFIITMNEEDEIRKKEFQEEASVTREENAKLFSEYTERKAAEASVREAQEKAKQEQELLENQAYVRKQAWQKDGRTDVEFSKDGSRWKYQDESWDSSRHI